MQDLGNKDFWQEKWQRPNLPAWDLKDKHPLLEELIDRAEQANLLPKNSHIFTPGCGRAHNSAYLSTLGHKVTVLDIAPEAIEGAQKLYQTYENMSFNVGDVFSVKENERELYDAVFDRAMLCALDPERRPYFIKTIVERLKPGGIFMSISFSKTHKDGGPPFAITFKELDQLFSEKFTLASVESRTDGSCDKVIAEEQLIIWRKK